MKIFFLNLYYGVIEEKLIDFINEHKVDTDVFCFQESADKLQPILIDNLKDFSNVAIHKFINFDDDYFQSTFVKNNLKMVSKNNLFEGENTLGLETDLEIDDGNRTVHLGNIQGFARPGNKLDTPDRLEQSKRVLERFAKFNGAKIIGGDFNLFPETESVKMFVKAGYGNLILEYGIKTTRNEVAWRNYPNNKQLFADYVFVSPEIKVKKFEVIENEISDHLPMVLEIE